MLVPRPVPVNLHDSNVPRRVRRARFARIDARIQFPGRRDSSSIEAQKSSTQRGHDRGRSIADAKFLEDVPSMNLNRLVADAQLAGDLPVPQPTCHLFDHAKLPRCERG